jgi:POT family proton-dependent oligopeptide transporter
MMMIGHLLLSFAFLDKHFLYLGLALVAIGTSAFKGNITNILGLAYKNLNLLEKQNKAFVFFYSMVNLGGLMASIICGTVGMKYSWHLGFGLAALGMAIGLTLFMSLHKKILADLDGVKKPITFKANVFLLLGLAVYTFLIQLGMAKASLAIYFLQYLGFFFISYYLYLIYQSSGIERKNLAIMFVLMVFYVVFYALEMQTGALIVLFSSRNVDLVIGGYEIAATSVDSINPLVVMLAGFITYFLLQEKKDNKFIMRLTFGLSMIPLSFAFLYLGTLLAHNSLVHIVYLILSMSFMALGEIFVGPIIQSRISDLSPNNKRGFVFGALMFAASYANLVGNFAANYMAVDKVGATAAESLLIYQEGFLKVIEFTSLAVVLFILVSPFIKGKAS